MAVGPKVMKQTGKGGFQDAIDRVVASTARRPGRPARKGGALSVKVPPAASRVPSSASTAAEHLAVGGDRHGGVGQARRAEAGRSASAVDVAADRAKACRSSRRAVSRAASAARSRGSMRRPKANPTASRGSAGPACAVIVAVGKVRRLGRRRRSRGAPRRRSPVTGRTILERTSTRRRVNGSGRASAARRRR